MAPPPRTGRWWPLRTIGLVFGLSAFFLAGTYAGRWAVKNQISTRLRAEMSALLKTKPAPMEDDAAEWVTKNTALVRLQTRVVPLPRHGGWGGGLQSLGDGRLLYATRDGEFGMLSAEGAAQPLGFRIDMARDELLAHPVARVKSFNSNWFRVTDINVWRIGPDRFDLVVAHHHFDLAHACVRLSLSRGQLVEADGELRLSGEFRTVMNTDPCITFNQPGFEHVFEGHFSGGRIARSAPEEALLSTGDHGWVGLRGYPAVSQDDRSTLGKLLRVNLTTGRVSIVAKGFRNPQGLTIDSKGRIWVTDHGPAGGDELNLVREGANYGWPLATYGTDYGPRPWPFNAQQGKPDFGVLPQFAFVPSFGISNLIEVTGDAFSLWRGDLLLLSLAGQTMYRLRLEGDRVMYAEPIDFEGKRLRTIVELPDGGLAMLTDLGTVIYVRNADTHGVAPYLDVRKQQRRTDEMTAEEQAFAVAGRFAGGDVHVADAAPSLSDDAAAGREVFATHCSTCHAFNSEAVLVGPSLKGVIGRRVGATEFAYSRALSDHSGVWTSADLVAFAVEPVGRFAGTTMRPVTLSHDQQHALRRYLETASSSMHSWPPAPAVWQSGR